MRRPIIEQLRIVVIVSVQLVHRYIQSETLRCQREIINGHIRKDSHAHPRLKLQKIPPRNVRQYQILSPPIRSQILRAPPQRRRHILALANLHHRQIHAARVRPVLMHIEPHHAPMRIRRARIVVDRGRRIEHHTVHHRIARESHRMLALRIVPVLVHVHVHVMALRTVARRLHRMIGVRSRLLRRRRSTVSLPQQRHASRVPPSAPAILKVTPPAARNLVAIQPLVLLPIAIHVQIAHLHRAQTHLLAVLLAAHLRHAARIVVGHLREAIAQHQLIDGDVTALVVRLVADRHHLEQDAKVLGHAPDALTHRVPGVAIVAGDFGQHPRIVAVLRLDDQAHAVQPHAALVDDQLQVAVLA